MTAGQITLRYVTSSLTFYWRTNLWVLAGVAVATTVIVGALVVGDSVRGTLGDIAAWRLGKVQYAMSLPQGNFRDALAGEISSRLSAPCSAAITARAVASVPDESARINDAQLLGVDEDFWRLSSSGAVPPGWPLADGSALVNRATAAALGVGAGGEIIVRVAKPSALPADAPQSGPDDRIQMRLTVAGVLGDGQFGRFDLRANQVPPCNVFVSRSWLAGKLTIPGKANLLLCGKAQSGTGVSPASLNADAPSLDQLNAALKEKWQLADAGLSLRTYPSDRDDLPSGPLARAYRPPGGFVELRSDRIFIDPAVAQRVAQWWPTAEAYLTYVVNSIRVAAAAGPATSSQPGDTAGPVRETPYSMVTAAALLGNDRFRERPLRNGVPPLMDDGVWVNQWLAEDLGVGLRDELEMSYFVLGEGGRLQERRTRFHVSGVVKMNYWLWDPSLMPDFPGVSDAKSCKDWKPGTPIDLAKIRKKDEAYWDDYRGTPKAFISLSKGQEIWGNRWGNLTAIRFPGADANDLAAQIRARLGPSAAGLFFSPVGEQALSASRPAMDMGQLFLGFSMFLIGAAVLLTGLLFSLSVQQRWGELGLLLAVGLGRGQVRRLLLAQGAVLAAVGCAIGVAGGVAYGRAIVWGLGTFWSGAVGEAQVHFHQTAASLLAGAGGAMAIAILTIWLGLRNAFKRTPHELLGGFDEGVEAVPAARLAGVSPAHWGHAGRGRVSLCLAIAALGGAVTLAAIFGGAGAQAGSEMFFASAALLLVACLSATRWLFASGMGVPPMSSSAFGRREQVERTHGQDAHATTTHGQDAHATLTLLRLALTNMVRRRGRSLAIVTLLACGSFMIVAVAAFRPIDGALTAVSGPSGGFNLLAQSTLPIKRDFATAAGRRSLGLHELDGAIFEILPLRVSGGDDASCLNLNRPQQPRLYGAPGEQLQRRGAFAFVKELDAGKGWAALRASPKGGEIPAIGDVNTVTWALGKGVGDTIQYADEHGQPVTIRIVGVIANSILQGGLVIDEDAFTRIFPSHGGHQMLLIQTPPDQAGQVAARLSQALGDAGLAVTPASRRLAQYNAVENAYLSIFQALGGLGMVLGSAGLAVVVLRNVMERRGELALLQAVGFGKARLVRLVLLEHWGLLAAGLSAGTLSALVAVAPMAVGQGRAFPLAWLAMALGFIWASSIIWVYLATRMALAGDLLPALRNE
jgi:ABC-type antimicrobial peptide transport system permease subunit